MVTAVAKKRTKVCPHCGRPISLKGNPYRPFCSERCRLIDLGKWATGEYRIAGQRTDADEEEEKKKRSSEEKGNK